MAPEEVRVDRVRTPEHHELALRLVDEVYVQERGWMDRPDLDNFPPGSNVSWFLATVGRKPAALLRVLYDPTLPFPSGIGGEPVSSPRRVAEVGRLMIAESFRGHRRVVLKLLGASTREVVSRRYTHLVTEVVEGDSGSPYLLPTQILGFERMGSGPAAFPRVRLVLDIERGVRNLATRGGPFFREFVDGQLDVLESRFGPLAGLPRVS